MEKKEVDKEVKVQKSSFYLFLFNRIKEGKTPSSISKEYQIPKQKLQYYLNQLKKGGFIEKVGYKSWKVKVKEFSLGTRPTTNLHALQINIPILSGEIKGSDWEVKEELRNWTPKYKTLDILGGLTIKNNNNKSISIFAHSRDLKELKEIDALSYDIVNFALEWFKRDFNVTLDLFNAEVKSLHIATQDKVSEDMQKQGDRFELDLQKKAEKVFPKDKIDGKAWIDGSPFTFTAETNDKEWKRAYLSMPFMMEEIAKATHYIALNYASHVKLVEKASKVMEKLDKRLSQTKLTEFL
ncbi:MAG: hypothetical protein ABSG05_03365 [Candidatus Pacearchaeota archaeon]|jgi:hypothetical protein